MGVLKDSIEKCARLISASAAFQEHVAKYTADGADSRVYRVFAGNDINQKPEELARPFALIEIGARNSQRIAEGVWDGEGFLVLKFCSNMENVDTPGQSLIDFTEWCYTVLEQMKALAGADDHLNLRELEQESEPAWVPPEQGHETPWCWASWRLRWARF